MRLMEEKQAVRRAVRARLHAQPPAERALRSADACAQLIAHPAFQRAAVLLAYCAMPQECDRPASALPFHCACRGTALRCTNRSHRMRLHPEAMAFWSRFPPGADPIFLRR